MMQKKKKEGWQLFWNTFLLDIGQFLFLAPAVAVVVAAAARLQVAVAILFKLQV